MFNRQEITLVSDLPIIQITQSFDLPVFPTEDFDEVTILIKVSLIGTPESTDIVNFTPLVYDESGTPYVLWDPVYASQSFNGATTDLTIAFPYSLRVARMGLRVSGTGSLSDSNGFLVTAKAILWDSTDSGD